MLIKKKNKCPRKDYTTPTTNLPRQIHYPNNNPLKQNTCKNLSQTKSKLYTLSLATLVFPLQLSISSQQYTPPFRLVPYPFQICKSSCSLLKKKKNEKHNRGNTLKISYNKRLSSYRRRAWINKRVSSLRSLGFRSERSGGRVVHAWT